LPQANGIEMAVMGYIDLFNIQTYTDLADTVRYMYGMNTEDWCDALQMLKLSYDNLSTDDTVNASLSVICGLAFFGGGLAKVTSKLSKLKCAKKIKKVLQRVNIARVAEEKLKPLPAVVMSGMYLNYAAHPFVEANSNEEEHKGKQIAV